MTTAAVSALRVAELTRRVEALPAELQAWRARCLVDDRFEPNHSQVQAIEVLIAALHERQRELLKRATAPIGDWSAALVDEIVKSQRVFAFFRDKLELRFSPTFQPPLWLADIVAHDCHQPVLATARAAGILSADACREPPLTYLTAEVSAATWVRGSQPSDGRSYALGTATLPIPVIELPWDHAANLWEYLSLHHEVAHDLEADLGLRPALLAALEAALVAAKVSVPRRAMWQAWHAEVFADLVALQLAGPAFADGLMHVLLLPAPDVLAFVPSDPHPTHYPRILMLASYIRTLGAWPELGADADRIVAQWQALYGESDRFRDVLAEFDHVARAVMDTALAPLNGGTVRGLIPYTDGDDRVVRAAARYLRTDTYPPGHVPPRHVVSAARLAASAAAAAAPDQLATALNDIQRRATELIRASAPGGVLGAPLPPGRIQFITDFARHL